MAPPSPRRPGFSRRAQYGLFAGYVVAILGMLVALLLLVSAHFDPQGHARLQALIGDLTAPISRAGRSTLAALGDGGQSIGAYFNAASKNKAMAAELRQARMALIKGAADAREVARLKRVVKLVEWLPQPIATARIVASTPSSSRRYAMLGAGDAQGIAVGQSVIGPEGLIGRVVQTGSHSARIVLIVDASTIVPVRRLRDGVPAMARGNGYGQLELRALSTGNNPFRTGDIFVTSGTGGIYRPGLPVAIVLRAGRDTTIAAPLADPARYDFASVEPEFIAVLPEPPTGTP